MISTDFESSRLGVAPGSARYHKKPPKNNPKKQIIAFQITLDIIDGQSELQQPDWAVETGTSTLKARDVADGPISSTLLLRTIPSCLAYVCRLSLAVHYLSSFTRLDFVVLTFLLRHPGAPPPSLGTYKPATTV